MLEVTLETIQMSLVSPHRIVVLKEVAAERYLPIWIGPCEAEAISLRLQGVEMPRPLTHDLIVSLLNTFGADLLYIHIHSLTENTFYAKLVLKLAGEEIGVDSRPSDALAIAVRMDAPIYVSEAVMNAAGVAPEETATDGEGKDLGVFRDFLNSLNLDAPPTDQP